MKFRSFFCWIFMLIIPIPFFAQKDTLKPNFGINSIQIGVAQPADVCAYYHKRLAPSIAFRNHNYKKLKIRNATFYFVRVDSVFLLKSIQIKPTFRKFHLQEDFVFFQKTRIKHLILVLDTPKIAHLSQLNSVVYENTILNFGGFECYVKPSKNDLTATSSHPLPEYLLKDYMNSKIKKLYISCDDCDFPYYPNSRKTKNTPQLFYSSYKHYGYYKDQDSLIRIDANFGCLECSTLPYFQVNFYTKKQRIKTSYSLSGFVFYVEKYDKLYKILNKLKKGALRKTEYIYLGKQEYHIRWKRKNIRSPYYIEAIEHHSL